MQSKSGLSPPQLIHDRLFNGYEYVDTYIHISGLQLGPALGGCRIHHYERRSEAIANVERLSRCMQYKSALRRLPYGGGKTVINADPDIGKNHRLLRNYADMVNDLKGDYITAEDSGADLMDMDYLSKFTPHVVGISKYSGNPSPVTAYGIYHALMAALRHKGHESVEGLTIVLKGAGSVAQFLLFGFPPEDRHYDEFRDEFSGLLHMKPKAIHYAEKSSERSFEFKKMARDLGGSLGSLLKAESPDDIYDVPNTDIFIPAAVRYSVTGSHIDHLALSMQKSHLKLVVGPENNQLKDEQEDLQKLINAGITYLPDYASNAGGLIDVHFGKIACNTKQPYDQKASLKEAATIGKTIEDILAESKKSGKSTLKVAQEMAERIIAKSGNAASLDC